jgi:hypothetical protein
LQFSHLCSQIHSTQCSKLGHEQGATAFAKVPLANSRASPFQCRSIFGIGILADQNHSLFRRLRDVWQMTRICSERAGAFYGEAAYRQPAMGGVSNFFPL